MRGYCRRFLEQKYPPLPAGGGKEAPASDSAWQPCSNPLYVSGESFSMTGDPGPQSSTLRYSHQSPAVTPPFVGNAWRTPRLVSQIRRLCRWLAGEKSPFILLGAAVSYILKHPAGRPAIKLTVLNLGKTASVQRYARGRSLLRAHCYTACSGITGGPFAWPASSSAVSRAHALG